MNLLNGLPIRILFALIICFQMVITPLSFSQSSVIMNLENSMKSIVNITTETGGLYRSPSAAFRDKKTGRIVVGTSLKAAKYARGGAGVIVDSSGIIVTNAHVVNQASRIEVTLNDGKKVPAEIIDIVQNEDIAIIKIEPPYALTPIQFADSNNLALRSNVYSIGASEYLKGTLSQGKVTGIGQKAKGKTKQSDYIDLIKTSFNVYKGDSGGPLLDAEGKLLGLIVATQTTERHATFAIPSNTIRKYYFDYLKNSKNNKSVNI